MSDAMRIMMTPVAEEKRLPFNLRVPNSETLAAMKDADEGKMIRCADVDTLLADLDGEDD
ncbi:MAG: type II toxin-antitoxin system RelB/DinJ family antitoxin [Gammaproteobacteria bacterium]